MLGTIFWLIERHFRLFLPVYMAHFIVAKLSLLVDCGFLFSESRLRLWLYYGFEWPCWRGDSEIKSHNGLWLYSADVGCRCQVLIRMQLGAGRCHWCHYKLYAVSLSLWYDICLQLIRSGDSRMKKVGGHCGVKEKVGGGLHKCQSCMAIFHCFED